MAEFCRDCASEMWGNPDCTDFDGISTKADTDKGLYAPVLCEGCGHILVDHTGLKVGVLKHNVNESYYNKV